jgi:5-methylcytosine-specific restriction endonuclease McrA
MPSRQVIWAARARFTLRFQLGDCCAICSSTRNLEFDCIQPQGHAHHAAGVIHRTVFYRKQHREGNLQLLCKRCHKKKSVAEHKQWLERQENEPF